MDSKSTQGSGWRHIKTDEVETYAMIFDVHIEYVASEINTVVDDTAAGEENELSYTNGYD